MTFLCKQNCSFCCTPVPLDKSIIEKNPHWNNIPIIKSINLDNDKILLINKNFTCVYLENNKCLIYRDRPEICRTFGLSANQPCPYKTNRGIMRTKRETEILIKYWLDRIEKMKQQF